MINTVVDYAKKTRSIVVAGNAVMARRIDEQGLLRDALKVVVGNEADDGWIRFGKILEDADEEQALLQAEPAESGSEKIMFFTSGSTALPKGCVWEYPRGALAVQRIPQSSSHIGKDSRIFVPLPNNHVAAYICIPPWIYRGAATVFQELNFEPDTIIQGMVLENCTDVLAVPTMTHALSIARHSLGASFPNLTIALAGSPCTTVHVREYLEGLGAKRVENCWGMTECIQNMTGGFSDTKEFVRGGDISVGKVPLAARIKVCEPDEQSPVPIGVPGELHINSRTLIPEYLGSKGSNSDFYVDD
jgi:acyl-CoA synthetase (AMP-forming)/AMP-acid ligase II